MRSFGSFVLGIVGLSESAVLVLVSCVRSWGFRLLVGLIWAR
jgi:hypothetical protein